jgi:hypothetical protein
MDVRDLPENFARFFYYRYLEKKYEFLTSDTEGNQKSSVNSDSPDNVLLIVVDCFRPDFLPDIGFDFEYAVAPAPWTFPSVTSINTSLYRHEHGSVAHTMPDDEEYAMPKQTEDVDTLQAFL